MAITNIILKSADEALGKKKKYRNKKRHPIWNEEIANLILEKKTAYLKFLSTGTKKQTDLIEYKRKTTLVKIESLKIWRQNWEMFLGDIEHDEHGKQVKAYKLLKRLNQDTKDILNLN